MHDLLNASQYIFTMPRQCAMTPTLAIEFMFDVIVLRCSKNFQPYSNISTNVLVLGYTLIICAPHRPSIIMLGFHDAPSLGIKPNI